MYVGDRVIALEDQASIRSLMFEGSNIGAETISRRSVATSAHSEILSNISSTRSL